MSLSIIVPTYNSEKFLNIFLSSVTEQNLDLHFEVIIVDNNSTDNTKEMVNRFINNNHNISVKHLFYSNKQSSYAARNFGIQHSSFENLVFTDADCILADDYVDQIFKLIQKKEYENTAFGGNIELTIEDSDNVWEHYDTIHLNNERTILSQGGIATANLIVSKTNFYKVGEFQEIASGADFGWSQRAKKCSIKLSYTPKIKVCHPTRKTLKDHCIKMKRIGRGAGQRAKERNNIKIYVVLLYLLKFLNFKTNIMYSKLLLRHLKPIKVFLFNFLFFRIRYCQLRGVIIGLWKN